MPVLAPATIPFLGLPTGASGSSLPRTDRRFWTLQLIIWPAYGIALMLPWLGIYSVVAMLPTKLVVAGSGLLASVGLRAVYRAVLRRWSHPGALILFVLIASLAAGLLWDSVLAGLLGGSLNQDLRRLGALGSGIPQFAGGLYHALVLLTWSMGYLGLKHYRSPSGNPVRVEPTGRLVLRDGRRAVVLDAEEIKWVEAAGDYVRVHGGPKRTLLRATMAGIEATLPATDYLRIHRSAIVRIAQVRELVPLPNSEYEVLLRDGTKLRASRTYAGRLRAVLGIGSE